MGCFASTQVHDEFDFIQQEHLKQQQNLYFQAPDSRNGQQREPQPYSYFQAPDSRNGQQREPGPYSNFQAPDSRNGQQREPQPYSYFQAPDSRNGQQREPRPYSYFQAPDSEKAVPVQPTAQKAVPPVQPTAQKAVPPVQPLSAQKAVLPGREVLLQRQHSGWANMWEALCSKSNCGHLSVGFIKKDFIWLSNWKIDKDLTSQFLDKVNALTEKQRELFLDFKDTKMKPARAKYFLEILMKMEKIVAGWMKKNGYHPHPSNIGQHYGKKISEFGVGGLFNVKAYDGRPRPTDGWHGDPNYKRGDAIPPRHDIRVLVRIPWKREDEEISRIKFRVKGSKELVMCEPISAGQACAMSWDVAKQSNKGDTRRMEASLEHTVEEGYAGFTLVLDYLHHTTVQD